MPIAGPEVRSQEAGQPKGPRAAGLPSRAIAEHPWPAGAETTTVETCQCLSRGRSHSRNHMSIMANGSVAQNRNGIGASSRRHSQRYGNAAGAADAVSTCR